jgi:formylglycine-generating enzyme required for sulfatase activity
MFLRPLVQRKSSLVLALCFALAALLFVWSGTQPDRVSAQPQATASVKPINNSLRMKLVLIPAGEFTMGSAIDQEGRFSNESPPQKVRISKPFYMGTHEVTQRQYREVMGANPSRYKLSPEHPVEQVTWEEAVQFCRKLSDWPFEKEARRVYRLPTEAEWEYACRAGTTTAFSCGDTLTDKHANFQRDTDRTARVGSYKPNAFGLYDMHGNVWEWCQDWFDAGAYQTAAGADPAGPDTGAARVIRGGGWHSEGDRCRSAVRDSFTPAHRFHDIGFRVVCTVLKP